MGQIKNIKLHIVTDIKIITIHRDVLSSPPASSMDQITSALEPAKEFAKDSFRLVKRCTNLIVKSFRRSPWQQLLDSQSWDSSDSSSNSSTFPSTTSSCSRRMEVGKSKSEMGLEWGIY